MNWRSSLSRPAPSARRTAISRPRKLRETSSRRFATFEQASTQQETDTRRGEGDDGSPKRPPRPITGQHERRAPVHASGFSSSSRLAMAVSSLGGTGIDAAAQPSNHLRHAPARARIQRKPRRRCAPRPPPRSGSRRRGRGIETKPA